MEKHLQSHHYMVERLFFSKEITHASLKKGFLQRCLLCMTAHLFSSEKVVFYTYYYYNCDNRYHHYKNIYYNAQVDHRGLETPVSRGDLESR